MDEAAPKKPRRKVWTFLRMFRWAVYIFFASLMLFTAVCVATGVISNLSERFPELTVQNANQHQGKITDLALRDCRDALGRMRQEDLKETTKVFTGKTQRDEFLRKYRTWSRDWRKRFEKLGINCHITSDLQSFNSMQQRLAIVYQKVDELHRYHTRLVKKYITQNSLRLKQIHQLMKQLENMEGMPQGDQPQG